ncbi:MAG: S41 family peptidase [Lysobacterales bacterium]
MKLTRYFLLTACLVLLTAPQTQAQSEPGQVSQLTLDDLRTFTDVFEQIRSNYIDEIGDAELLRAAIRGMLSETDGYSTFIDEEAFQALDRNTRGHDGGIGALVIIQKHMLVVSSVQKGGPADRAGLDAGDRITAVDGIPVRGRSLADSIDALNGNPGSVVQVTALSPGQDAREIELTRESFPVASVSGEWLESGIGKINISHFHQNTHREFQDQLQALQSDGASLDALIIDLQHNLGGALQSAVSIADGFLDDGLIARTRSRYPSTQMEFHANEGQWTDDIPLALLVDEKTASASEVMAAALQDHGRATVIGTRTYGKGSIQSVLNLRNGSALRLTTAIYYTPDGHSLQERGIEPDIEVTDAGERLDRAVSELRGHLDQDG